MEIDEPRSAREPTKDDIALVAEQMQAGTDPETIASMLEDRGLDRTRARAPGRQRVSAARAGR